MIAHRTIRPDQAEGKSNQPPGSLKTESKSARLSGAKGEPLDARTSAQMAARFGHDFSRVRVHSSSAAAASAKQRNADAYTIGESIFFDEGRFNPQTREGEKLLAHELAHTIQQTQAGSNNTIASAEDSEREAARAATDVRPKVSSRRPVGVQKQAKTGDPTQAISNAQTSGTGAVTIDGFETGKADLSKGNASKLAEAAAKFKEQLKTHPGSTLRVTGHTDAIGTDERNMALGQRRADSVRDELVKDGLPPEAIKTESKGESQLLIDTKKQEPRNRRVEITIESPAQAFSDPAMDPGTTSPGLKHNPIPDLFGPKGLKIPIDPTPTFHPPMRPPDGLPPDFWKPIPPAPARGGTSLDSVIDGFAHKITSFLPKSVREKAQSLVKDAIEKGITAGLDQALQQAGVGDKERQAIQKAAEAAIKQKIGGSSGNQ